MCQEQTKRDSKGMGIINDPEGNNKLFYYLQLDFRINVVKNKTEAYLTVSQIDCINYLGA